MTHELQRGWAEQTRSERPTSVRHLPARASRYVQARPHELARDGHRPGAGIHTEALIARTGVASCCCKSERVDGGSMLTPGSTG